MSTNEAGESNSANDDQLKDVIKINDKKINFSKLITPRKNLFISVSLVSILIISGVSFTLLKNDGSQTQNDILVQSQDSVSGNDYTKDAQSEVIEAVTKDALSEIVAPENVAIVVDNYAYVKTDGVTKPLSEIGDYDQVLGYRNVNETPTLFVLTRYASVEGEDTKPAEVYGITGNGKNLVFKLPEDATFYSIEVSPDGSQISYEHASDGFYAGFKDISIYDIASQTSTIIYEDASEYGGSFRFQDWVGDVMYYSEGCRECDGGTRLILHTINTKTKEFKTIFDKQDEYAGSLLSAEFLVSPAGSTVVARLYDHGINFDIRVDEVKPTQFITINLETGSTKNLMTSDSFKASVVGFGLDEQVYILESDLEEVDRSLATREEYIDENTKKYLRDAEPVLYSVDATTGKKTELSSNGELKKFIAMPLGDVRVINNSLHMATNTLNVLDGSSSFSAPLTSEYYIVSLQNGIGTIETLFNIKSDGIYQNISMLPLR